MDSSHPTTLPSSSSVPLGLVAFNPSSFGILGSPSPDSFLSSAYMATPSTINDPSQYIDSGATDHITFDLNNLFVHLDYNGKAKITIGNGSSLLVSHIGDYVISNTNSALLLHNILHVSQIRKNLLIVSMFTKDNNVFSEFHVDHYFIKDKIMRKVIFQGGLKNGL